MNNKYRLNNLCASLVIFFCILNEFKILNHQIGLKQRVAHDKSFLNQIDQKTIFSFQNGVPSNIELQQFDKKVDNDKKLTKTQLNKQSFQQIKLTNEQTILQQQKKLKIAKFLKLRQKQYEQNIQRYFQQLPKLKSDDLKQIYVSKAKYFREKKQYLQRRQSYLNVRPVDINHTEQLFQNHKLNQQKNKLKINKLIQLAKSQQNQEEKRDSANQQQQKNQFISIIKPNCTKKYKIIYIWIGEKKIPQQYKQIVKQCQNSTLLLGNQDFHKYIKKWDDQHELKIDTSNWTNIKKVAFFKVLYLYYQAGAYSDFDTQMNEQCFDKIISNQLVFGNINYKAGNILIPEQNFLYVKQKKNEQVYRMVLRQIKTQNRWVECAVRQCIIANCFNHYRDNTYRKGFD